MATQRCIPCRDTLRVTRGRLPLSRAYGRDPAPPTRRQRQSPWFHQLRWPGTEHAQLHFLSGGRFSADFQYVYEKRSLPVWMLHGVRGDISGYRVDAIVTGRTNWRFSVFPTGALPHFEVPGEFVAAYGAFLAGRSDRASGKDPS